MISISEEELKTLQVCVQSGNLVSCRNTWGGTNMIGDSEKLYFVLDGEFIYEIGGKNFLVKAGQMVYIPANTLYNCRLTRKQKLNKYYIHYTATIQNESLFQKLGISNDNYVLTIADRAPVEKMFQKLFYFTDYFSSTAKLVQQQAVLTEIIAFYIERCFTSSSTSVPKLREKFAEIVTYMENHLAEPLTLTDLSNMQLMNSSQLVREFRQAFGLSPMRYFDKLRVEKAEYLLRETDSPVHMIACAIGIVDQAYFSRFFKNHTSMTPTEYRKSF